MRNCARKYLGPALAGISLLAGGCVESRAVKQSAPFETRELDACMAIMIDMSGSFSQSWDDRAYDLFIRLSEQVFADAMGSESRLVIAQLSNSSQAVIFDGRPGDLQKRFRSPEDLNRFLHEQSDASRSRVFDSTQQVIEYVGSIAGVTEQTELMTVICSDMMDSESDQQLRASSGRAMIESLRNYRAKGGGLALYFVAQDEVPRWQRILDEAGFEAGHYVIENELTVDPQLPRFN